MKHTMGVPDTIWTYGQAASDQENPSSFLRELLIEAIMSREYLVGEHARRALADDHRGEVVIGSAEPVEPAQLELVKPPRDRGSLFEVEPPGAMCDECHMFIEPGETGLIRRGLTGHKEILHVDHVRRQQ
jgi:hypothetical protein